MSHFNKVFLLEIEDYYPETYTEAQCRMDAGFCEFCAYWTAMKWPETPCYKACVNNPNFPVPK